MKISIAMATYNGERYLDGQLDSFVCQTMLPDELIVCDDGSSDRTLEIIKLFARIAPFPVHVHRNSRRLGYPGNFGRAITLSHGGVVFLSDQDDVWFPEKLQSVMETFHSPERPLVVINNAEITDAFLRPTRLTKLGQTRSAGLSLDDFITGCCTAFRRDIHPLILPIPVEYCVHDSWIHRVGRTLGRRTVVSESLQYYRRHGENASRWLTSRTTPITGRDRAILYGRGDSRVWCARRLAELDLLSNRLREKGIDVERLSGETLDLKKALSHIQREREAVESRAGLLKKNRLVRPFAAWKLFRRGGYEHFSGWKSFVKDLGQ